MAGADNDPERHEPPPAWLRGRRGEQVVFALLAIVIWPFLAVALVGGYGFAVWMYQLLAGPPGPPGL